jgi:hypothetical protein
MKQLLFMVTLILLGSTGLQAKDMNHRLGVGPKIPFHTDLPAVAIHYFPNANYTITGALGINTESGYSQLGLQGGIRRILFEEQNMNFFVGGALGVISKEFAGVNQSGFELMATGGGEFFFQGLENLGFNFEMGIGVASLKNSNRFFTVAATPWRAGLIFYF